MPPQSSQQDQKKRRWALKALSIALLGTIIAIYTVWTRVSAQMVLRWFVRETGIPVEIRSATWDVRWRELTRGKIRALHLNVFYKPLNASIFLDTPVEYKRHKEHWSIQLAPVLKIGNLPPARGTIALELDVKRKGRKASAEGAQVELHLRQTDPLTLRNDTGSLSVGEWHVDGFVGWTGELFSELEIKLKNVTATDANATQTLSAESIHVTTDILWPELPPFPFETKAKLRVSGIQFLRPGFLATEPEIALNTGFVFDGRDFNNVNISVDKPLRLSARGSLRNGRIDSSFEVNARLEELFTERIARWLEGQVPVLRRAKAKGSVSLKGHATIDERKTSAQAQLKLQAESIELPARDLYVEGLTLDAPVEFPGVPDWGALAIKTTEFHSVKLKNLSVHTRLWREGIDIMTEDEDGKDYPIRQSVWGGIVEIAHLYAHVGMKGNAEFTMAMTGGPFSIPAIQNDLCLLPQQPIKGSLSFTYPEIVLDHDSIALVGDTNLDIFNGKTHVGDIRLSFGELNPKLAFSVDWSDLDLQAIGEWSRLGDIRGSLDGYLRQARIALTRHGAFPLSYELEVRGQKRGGSKIRFYGRAVYNILELLGAPEQIRQGPAGLLIKAGTFWRNLLPAKADVLGFRAKVDGDWTEMSTFDLPEDASSLWCSPEKHYIVCGNGFTMPLNTHGVYPLIMKTSAFHKWLNDRMDYINWFMNNQSKAGKPRESGGNNGEQTECKSFF